MMTIKVKQKTILILVLFTENEEWKQVRFEIFEKIEIIFFILARD